MHQFMKLFGFDQRNTLCVGIERECFITNEQGRVVPRAHQILDYLRDPVRFGYELSACQLEERVGPCTADTVRDGLLTNEEILRAAERVLRFGRLHDEVGPDDMPLDVYPDPSGRCTAIARSMPRHVLLAACQIIGTHIHVGMPDHVTALQVYNRVVPMCARLCDPDSRRLQIYRTVAPHFEPPSFPTWQAFHEAAVRGGYAEDPRRCWNLIRISVHGTIEFRMFGATASLDTVVAWARLCHDLCQAAME